MQKNKKIACVLFYDNKIYDTMFQACYDSFRTFHADEVDIISITPYTVNEFGRKFYTTFPDVNGIRKYSWAYEIMKQYDYNKVIILDVDVVICSRLDEFLDDNEHDVLATLNYPCKEGTEYWETPAYEIEDSAGRIIYDSANINAGVACFNSADALKKVIDLSIEHPTHFAEQGGLNELAWVDQSYTVRVVDGPYLVSNVVYNARSKGVYGTEMIGPDSPISRFYVKDKKLYTEDHKRVKSFHFIEGLGCQNIQTFKKKVDAIKLMWFNNETKKFFKDVCNTGDFFEIPYEIPQ